MRARPAPRRLVATTWALAMGVVLIAPSAASADASSSTIDQPPPDSAGATGTPDHPYATAEQFPLAAHITRARDSLVKPDSGEAVVLHLKDPAGTVVEVDRDTSGDQTIGRPFDTGCALAPAPCNTRTTLNGTWQLFLTGDGTDGGPAVEFSLALPPLPPAAVGARANGRSVTVTWQRGSEPDLLSYAVSADGGAAGPAVTPQAGCQPEGTCSAVVTLPVGNHTVVVQARRPTAPGSSSTLDATSAPVKVTVAGPTPTASASPSPGGTAGHPSASPGASGSPFSLGHASPSGTPVPLTPAQQRALALQFRDFQAQTTIPKLPPQPQLPAVAGEGNADAGQGAYAPTLGYSDRVIRESAGGGSALARGVRAVTGLDPAALGGPLAGSLILLLTAGHLRRLASAGRDRD